MNDLQPSFRAGLIFCKDLGISDFAQDFKGLIKNSTTADYRPSIKKFDILCQKLKNYSEAIMRKFQVFDFSNLAVKHFLSDFNYGINVLMSSIRSNEILPESIFLRLSRLSEMLKDISNEYANTETFISEFQVGDEFKSVLMEYINRGRVINTDESYTNSPIETLEKFAIEGRSAIEEYLGVGSVMDDDTLESMFFAIIAPSLEGKTQSAFAFKSIKPLYFLFPGKRFRNDFREIQRIYVNFIELSNELLRLSLIDLNEILFLNDLTREDDESLIYDHISRTSLTEKYKEIKFYTLGFIVALINHSRDHLPLPEGISWMEFYATRTGNLVFSGVSLKELIDQEFNFGEFVLFLDEFRQSFHTVLCRNLAIAAKIKVFVANTNTNVANLGGRQELFLSRTPEVHCWSLATVQLNSNNSTILNGIHPSLPTKINEIVRNTTENDRNLLFGFFEYLFFGQLKLYRPGFIDWISDIILSFPISNQLSFNSILSHIIIKLRGLITSRKNRIISNPEAVLGTLALFLNNAYLQLDLNINTGEDVEQEDISHRKTYLQDHFYYVANPVDSNKWCFLTYPPQADESDLNCPLRIRQNGINFSEWKMEYTYFKSSEVLPFLACLTIPFENKSIVKLFKDGLNKISAHPNGTGNSSNTSQNVPLNGNVLENLAAVCIIESSQHDQGSLNPTFIGQSGPSFFINLIENLQELNGFRRKNKISLFYESNTIRSIIENIHVPFLFPAGMDLPEFIENNLSKPEGFNNRSVNFGTFKRTPNIKKIDSIFRYFDKSGSEISLQTCTIECKRWRHKLKVANLKKIITKAARNTAKLSLVFCNRLADAEESTIAALKEDCQRKNWNLLKFVRQSDENITKSFTLTPYFEELNLITDASINCIIIELKTINS